MVHWTSHTPVLLESATPIGAACGPPAEEASLGAQQLHTRPGMELLAKEMSGLSLSLIHQEESLSLIWFPHKVFLRKGIGKRSLSGS